MEPACTFVVSGWSRFSEENICGYGCIPSSQVSSSGVDTFNAPSLQGIVKKLMDFMGTKDMSAVLLNTCDELGRVDIAIFEDEEGTPASEDQVADWRKDKYRLWYSIYTFRIKKACDADLTNGRGEEIYSPENHK